MPLYELSKDAISAIPTTTFQSQSFSERSDLQRILKDHIEVIAAGLKVISEEFCEWEDSRRRIDLLAVDDSANLVVIELKRSEDGGHMELQALRYAAMVSQMTFSEASLALSRFKGVKEDEAKQELLSFFNWDETQTDEFGQGVLILLVSAEFSRELTTSVIWLNDQGLDIRCVRLRPYVLDGTRTILDVQRIVPLPEADEYTIQLKRKTEENRYTRTFNPDFSKYALSVGGVVTHNLNKRDLFHQAVAAVLRKGVSPEDVSNRLPQSKWIFVEGDLTGPQFRDKFRQVETKLGSRYDLGRYFCADGELFRIKGKTWVLSNQWALAHLPILDSLISLVPDKTIEYRKED